MDAMCVRWCWCGWRFFPLFPCSFWCFVQCVVCMLKVYARELDQKGIRSNFFLKYQFFQFNVQSVNFKFYFRIIKNIIEVVEPFSFNIIRRNETNVCNCTTYCACVCVCVLAQRIEYFIQLSISLILHTYIVINGWCFIGVLSVMQLNYLLIGHHLALSHYLKCTYNGAVYSLCAVFALFIRNWVILMKKK